MTTSYCLMMLVPVPTMKDHVRGGLIFAAIERVDLKK